MDLWRKLTIDWPCALGDWLWLHVIVAMATFLERLTLRRVVLYVGLLVLVIAFAQAMPAEFAYVFAGDTLTYLEIASAAVIAATRGQVRLALKRATQAVVRFAAGLRLARRRPGERGRRAVRAAARRGRADGGGSSKDDPAPWAGWALAA